MLKFCANLSTLFDEFPFIERFAQAKSYGFENYELQFPYDFEPGVIRSAAKGMKCVLMNTYRGDSFGFAAIPGGEDNFLDSLNKINSYYFELCVQKVHILSGLRDSNLSVDDQVNTLVQNLKGMEDYLDNFNMTAVIEPICSDVIKNYFMNSFDLAVQVINSVNNPNVKLLLDIYHLHQITGDVKQNLEKYYAYAGHIQVSQSPGRKEPYAEGGDIDYDFVFDFLRKKNHVDPIGLEYFRSDGKSTEQSLAWMKKITG